MPLAVGAGLGHLSDHPAHVDADHTIGGNQALEGLTTAGWSSMSWPLVSTWLTVADEPVFQGPGSPAADGLTTYVSGETGLGHDRNLAAVVRRASCCRGRTQTRNQEHRCLARQETSRASPSRFRRTCPVVFIGPSGQPPPREPTGVYVSPRLRSIFSISATSSSSLRII